MQICSLSALGRNPRMLISALRSRESSLGTKLSSRNSAVQPKLFCRGFYRPELKMPMLITWGLKLIDVPARE